MDENYSSFIPFRPKLDTLRKMSLTQLTFSLVGACGMETAKVAREKRSLLNLVSTNQAHIKYLVGSTNRSKAGKAMVSKEQINSRIWLKTYVRAQNDSLFLTNFVVILFVMNPLSR